MTGPHFRPFDVHQERDSGTFRFRGFADCGNGFLRPFVRRMRHVDPANIDPLSNHAPQNTHIDRRRPDGEYHLCEPG